MISLIGETAMAGAVGAGGIGNVAIAYGFNRYNHDVTILATVVIVGASGMAVASRDNQRLLNANAIAERLETFYKLNAYSTGRTYPTKHGIEVAAQSMIGDSAILIAPGSTRNSLIVATTTGTPTTMKPPSAAS